MEAPRKRATKEGEKWTASSSSSYSAITDIPSHILMEILFRLPIKTLVASKCVCKSWLHLINDPRFAKLHHGRANFEVCCQGNYEGTTTKLYMGSFHFLNDSRSIDMKLNTLLELPKFSVRSNNVPIYEVNRGELYIVNECNGLFCYFGESYKFAVIWNPITSEFITFPAPKRDKGLSTCLTYGLGFSQKANRFKLLRVMGRKEKKSSEEVVVAEICTIEKGCSWRTLGPCPFPIWKSPWHFYMFGTFFRGALHWFGKDRRSLDRVIVSFDFENEKFGKVLLPPDLRTMSFQHIHAKIGVLAGCLFVTDIVDQRCNIWLMKEYGVWDSWTLAISLQFTSLHEYEHYVPINYLDNGEILMIQGFSLVVYNPVLKSTRAIGIGRQYFTVVAYRPNLVLLKDSMMAYKVHVKPRCAGLEHRVMPTTPRWWKPMKYVITRTLEAQKLQQTQMSQDQTPQFMDARLDSHAPAVEDSHKGSSSEKSCLKSERLCGEGSSSVPPLSTTRSMLCEEYETSLKEMCEHFEEQLRDSQQSYEDKLHKSLQLYGKKLQESQQNQEEKKLSEEVAQISTVLRGEIARISAKLRDEISLISSKLRGEIA